MELKRHTELKSLDLSGTRLTAPGLADMQEVLPKLKIVRPLELRGRRGGRDVISGRRAGRGSPRSPGQLSRGRCAIS